MSLRGDLKKEENTSNRNQQKIKKKLAEHVSIFFIFFNDTPMKLLNLMQIKPNRIPSSHIIREFHFT